MKYRCTQRSPLALLVVALILAGMAGSAQAGDLPKRKPGLWEISMRMDKAPNMGPIQQCIDQNTDNLMQQNAKNEKHNCSVIDVKPAGNRVTVHTVCKMDGTTVTSDGVFEGSFETSYKGSIVSKFSPPMQGMAESRMTQEARWIGPCKPGQKPGDVTMPKMGTMNMQEMMNDPKIKEMMRKQMQ